MFKKDFFSGIFLVVLFSITGYMALSFPSMARELPLGLSALGVVFSAGLSVRALVRNKKGVYDGEQEVQYSAQGKKNIVMASCLLVAYVILISYLGFTVSTFLYLIASMAVLYPNQKTGKIWIIILVVSLVFSGMVYVVFKRLLYVPLPKGMLF